MKVACQETILLALPLVYVGAGLGLVDVFSPSASICTGEQKEQKECHKSSSSCQASDCTFTTWSAWSDIDCAGFKYSTRTVDTVNNKYGSACVGALKKTEAATPPATCANIDQNCELEAWTAWSPCKSVGGASAELDQRTRTRGYKNHVNGKGTACNSTLSETEPCGNGAVDKDCTFKPWGHWTSCHGTCGKGWHTRFRQYSHKKNKGKPCTGIMKEMSLCTLTACPPVACEWTNWNQWIGCDNSYPTQKTRTRSTKQGMTTDCAGETKQIKPCPVVSFQATDCVIPDWQAWQPCSVTCGGGTRTRNRNMQSPPRHGGHCRQADGTPWSLSQQGACNAQVCDPTICKYTTWSAWSDCTAICGPGTKRRHRAVDEAQTKLADGGCSGMVAEVAFCEKVACAVSDCKWQTWEDWSGCTSSCGGGTKRRNRMIIQNPSHGGTLCAAHSKAEIARCNMHVCHASATDAVWGPWQAWSACSKSCGGAYAHRQREVKTPNSPNGKPVSGSFSQFRNCSHNPPCIPPIDCKLHQWGIWSTCSATCFGIRHRARTIKIFANEVGRPCQGDTMGVLKMVEACNPGPGLGSSNLCDATPARDCTLEPWTQWTTCPVTCGGGQEYRKRQIIIPPSHRGNPCSEALQQTRACAGATEKAPCARVCHDCEMNDWSPWGACSACRGQRYRTRNVKKHPNYCGKQCNPEHVKETEDCQHSSPQQCMNELFCSWTEWTSFEGCNAECGPRTRKSQRSLHLSTTMPKNANGTGEYLFSGQAPLTCSGTVFRTEACAWKDCPENCVKTNCAYYQWSAWSVPTPGSSDATGLCRRHRQVQTIGNCGGEICKGNLIDSKSCARPGIEVVNCDLRDWGPWSHCHATGAQHLRVRTIRRHAQNGGTPCEGNTTETEPCSTGPENVPTACKWQDWFPWSQCSATCGVGWKMRHRANIAPKFGGAVCVGDLKELTTCDVTNEGACNVGAPGAACELTDWQPWGMCLVSGQRTRRRDVKKYAQMGGTPCNGTLEELGDCGQDVVDCKLSDWSEWSNCHDGDGNTISTCGRGQTERHRDILVFPTADGALCDKALTQIEPCGSMNGCPTMDCVMASWSSWSDVANAATCGDAQAKRTRSIVSNRKASGQPCKGAIEEYGNLTKTACPVCTWPDWSDWGQCTNNKDCKESEKKRTRAKPSGAACHDGDQPTEEYTHCNTTKQCTACTNGAFGNWGAWSVCHTNCGNGFQSRTRPIATHADVCGTPVTGPVTDVQPCTKAACHGDVACVWNDWGAWSTCSATCSGTFSRTRTIKTPPSGNGALCVGPMEQIFPCNPGWSTTDPSTGNLDAWPAGCPVGVTKKDCIMTTWTDWSCAGSCGETQGQRSRTVTQFQEHQGLPCVGALKETKICEKTACPNTPTDCVLNDWGAWSTCNACLGQTYRERSITLGSPAGKACPTNTTKETMKCGSTRNCGNNKHYCAWGDWTGWTSCSATVDCSTGIQTRKRALVNKQTTLRRISMGLLPSPSNVSTKTEVFYDKLPQKCVNGHNLGERLSGKTAEECAALCEKNPKCVAFESGFDYGGDEEFMDGDCQLKDDCNTVGCDGNNRNIDLFSKVGYKRMEGSCVKQHNIQKIVYSKKTVDECERLCDAVPTCLAFEFGVAYGGKGAFRPGDCMLNDAADPTGCDGRDQNLDLYVKAKCSAGRLSTSHLVCEKSKCLENGGDDEDCCSRPIDASCKDGYRYVKGDSCAGDEFFSTCCTLSPTLSPSMHVKDSVLYVVDDDSRHPKASRQLNMASAFVAGVGVFGLAALALRFSRRSGTNSYEPLSRTPLHSDGSDME